jgi:phage baseplate assembly protein V
MIAEQLSHLVIGVVSELHASIPGQVRVKFPHLEEIPSDWCSVVSPMGGPERGFVMLPEVGDNVLVGFEHGDTLRGFVLGSIWNKSQKTPAGDGNAKENNLRFIRSRSGHVVRLDDTKGKEKIEIIDKTKKQSIVIDSAANAITVTTEAGDVTVNAKSGKVAVNGSDITIKSTGAMTIEAKAALTIKGATVNIN